MKNDPKVLRSAPQHGFERCLQWKNTADHTTLHYNTRDLSKTAQHTLMGIEEDVGC
jgi:hypothetical protein